ncbi:hypothetical protein [Paragemmobacter straminiformis]|uniref:Uncharacterized protein n=1 Tax=Paragemmobacter straminiformis TaxID=2045119 RepID=A0A842I6B1_9RHOB|nr:hypothetical protein [Gemmobacter straminiformis]MBC2835612.1 hypothetical protein [Gemmobacter straminiformis]
MTDRIALIIGALAIGALLLDQALNGGAAGFFLLRKLAELIYFVSFWRH